MKKKTLYLFAIAFAFAFVACSDTHDCNCVVNGEEQQYIDSDKNCDELQNSLANKKAAPGTGNTIGTYCTEQ
ncbi:MAG: hypothetical protein LBL74_07920 [Bacteroidales bacterium]|jgi:hypothetical protein|nr:hypothetical protein [Bacteroidales bacterium]